MSEAELPLPDGYCYSGVVGKLRSEPNRRDVAAIVSVRAAAAAGVFTQNMVCAAPVQISRNRVNTTDVRGIVVCSGNANACTGEQGLRDAERMAELMAAELGCEPKQILVASTGIIGRPLPMPILEAAIPQAVRSVEPTLAGLHHAADAILTTDTVRKLAVAQADSYTILGVAKGAAMIGPNMATMLGFLMSDASVAPADLTAILKEAVDTTFNCISVEGHTSTNDTVFLLANGTSPPLQGEALQAFAGHVRGVCQSLAKQIANDAEGAKHTMTIQVDGLKTFTDARRVAKTVAESALVKTAIFGADPNWGRIVSAAGYAGVPFVESELSLTVGQQLLYKQGTPVAFDEATASDYLRNHREILIHLTFEQGNAACTFFTCDLTDEYIRLNADYTT